MSGAIRWGILGTGNIARQFATAVNGSRRGTIDAVGSRAVDKAAQFAAAHRIDRSYGDYQSLIDDTNIDAVYVSLPNSLHHEWTIKALRAGKHVLCEKPFAVNAAQSEEMFDVATRTGRVVTEAFMYRSHPLTHAVEKAVRDRAIGQVRLIRASFCYKTRLPDGNIRFRPELAGGVLMDVGCYCINFSRFFAGKEPSKIQVAANLHDSGVDDIAVGFLQFPNGVAATFTCGMSVHADNTAYICGSEGFIEVPIPWKPPVKDAEFRIAYSTPPKMDSAGKATPNAPPRQVHRVSAESELYALEADDFAAAVLDGALVRVSREDTLGNMRVLDEMRRQIST